MDYLNLFSHPEEPEFVSSRDTSAVEHPTFSDRPGPNGHGATTASP